MIAILASWVYIFLLTYAYGLVLYKAARLCRLIPRDDTLIAADYLSLVGLASITPFLGYWSLFFKIGLLANALLVAFACLFIALNFRDFTYHFRFTVSKLFRMNKVLIALWLIINVLILLNCLVHPKVYDTGLYHAQTIQWIEKYEAIKGLGNLHGRLAFNSSFFLPSALFSFSFLKIPPLHSLNGYLFILLSFTTIRYLGESKRIPGKHCFFYVGLFLLGMSFFDMRISSPSTDLPTAVLIWYIFLIILRKIELVRLRVIDFHSLIAIILVCLTVTVKLSAIPVALIILYLMYFSYDDWGYNHYICISIIAFFFLFQWIMRNVILSGYLVFPYPSIDIFSFDWKIPITKVVDEKNWILSWARIPRKHWGEVLSMPLIDWFPVWFSSKPLLLKTMFICCMTSPVVMAFRVIVDPSHYRKNCPFILCWAISFVGVLFWFFTAPDFRLVYGFMTVCVLIAIYVLFGETIFRSRSFSYGLLIVFAVFIIFFLKSSPFFSDKRPQMSFSNRWLFSEQYRTLEVDVKCLEGFTVSIPRKGDQCWDTPIPCVPAHLIENNLELRGQSIEDGFRIKSGR
jgi:hypothetical protein